MKWAGLLLIVLTGGAIGWRQALGLRQRTAALEELLRWIRQLAAVMRYTAAPLGELLADSSLREGYPALPFLAALAQQADGGSFSEIWRRSIDSEQGLAFTEEDRALLLRFGDQLGQTDIEGQLAHCALYVELLEERLAEAREAQRTKGHMYATLGVSGGLALAILLI